MTTTAPAWAHLSDTAPNTTVARTGHPVVGLGELQRAWEAVQAGRFRSTAGPEKASTPPAASSHTASSPGAGLGWFPAETVVPVIGAGGGIGTTTLALALATASSVPARVVECCSAAASGLAAASTAELGATDTGWRRGLRDSAHSRGAHSRGAHSRILLERAAAPITTAAAVPLPTEPDRPIAVTYLDCGWDLDHLLADGWLARLVTAAPALVVAADATIPGLRRLEITLDTLGADEQTTRRVLAGVLGPRRKKWGRPVEGSLGPRTRSLAAADALVEVPRDRHLASHGLTSAPLPQPLLNAASRLLDRLPTPLPQSAVHAPSPDPPLVDDQDC